MKVIFLYYIFCHLITVYNIDDDGLGEMIRLKVLIKVKNYIKKVKNL